MLKCDDIKRRSYFYDTNHVQVCNRFEVDVIDEDHPDKQVVLTTIFKRINDNDDKGWIVYAIIDRQFIHQKTYIVPFSVPVHDMPLTKIAGIGLANLLSEIRNDIANSIGLAYQIEETINEK